MKVYYIGVLGFNERISLRELKEGKGGSKKRVSTRGLKNTICHHTDFVY
ncbi:MAG: hypothetical protein HA493_05850 [Candidatus Verstraetearchaeota archaeon]|nr:hypothetical protein [Candidatus Verstraetearchaeota archaeon]